jgi:hypothetical protein
MSTLARIVALVGLLVYAAPAGANPPTAGPRPARRATRAAIPVAPPAPPVALQLTGLRIHVPLSRSAVVHAIGRDAWPQLVRCVTPTPRVRGYLTVNIVERERGTEASFVDSPVLRDRTLVACLQRALSSITLPPYGASRPDTSIAFDLVFMLPPLGTAPARRGAHR